MTAPTLPFKSLLCLLLLLPFFQPAKWKLEYSNKFSDDDEDDDDDVEVNNVDDDVIARYLCVVGRLYYYIYEISAETF